MKKVLMLIGLFSVNILLIFILLKYGFSHSSSVEPPLDSSVSKTNGKETKTEITEPKTAVTTTSTIPPAAKAYPSTFVGKVNKINGDQWSLIETTYTKFYMHGSATEFAWVSTELDNMVSFYLNFMNETWTRKEKLDIYLPDDASILRALKHHKGAYYTPEQDAIFFHPDALAFESDGKKTDIRFILMHELSHGIDHVEHSSTENLWLEESFATYMAYMYPYQDRSSDTDRIIIPFQNFYYQPHTFVEPSRELLDYVTRMNWATEEQATHLASFDGLNDYHYGKLTLNQEFDTTVLEASITDFLVHTYGQQKTVTLLNRYRAHVNNEDIDMTLKTVLDKNKRELNQQWQQYIQP